MVSVAHPPPEPEPATQDLRPYTHFLLGTNVPVSGPINSPASTQWSRWKPVVTGGCCQKLKKARPRPFHGNATNSFISRLIKSRPPGLVQIEFGPSKIASGPNIQISRPTIITKIRLKKKNMTLLANDEAFPLVGVKSDYIVDFPTSESTWNLQNSIFKSFPSTYIYVPLYGPR